MKLLVSVCAVICVALSSVGCSSLKKDPPLHLEVNNASSEYTFNAGMEKVWPAIVNATGAYSVKVIEKDSGLVELEQTVTRVTNYDLYLLWKKYGSGFQTWNNYTVLGIDGEQVTVTHVLWKVKLLASENAGKTCVRVISDRLLQGTITKNVGNLLSGPVFVKEPVLHNIPDEARVEDYKMLYGIGQNVGEKMPDVPEVRSIKEAAK